MIDIEKMANNFLRKTAGVNEMVQLLEKYPSTTDFLKDLARAQFHISDVDPNQPDAEKNDTYFGAKAMHDAIMGFANEFNSIESDYL